MRSWRHWDYGFWGVKTEIQAFNDILDAATLSVAVCGEDVEVTERFTYLGSDIHVSTGCVSQRSIDVCVGPGDSWIHCIMGCGAVGTCAGWKSESSGHWCFQCCSTDVRLGL